MSGYLHQLKAKPKSTSKSKPKPIVEEKEEEDETDYDVNVEYDLEEFNDLTEEKTILVNKYRDPSQFSVQEAFYFTLNETQMIDVHSSLITQLSAYRKDSIRFPNGKAAMELPRIELLKRQISATLERIRLTRERELEGSE
jgi:hypothetical protein